MNVFMLLMLLYNACLIVTTIVGLAFGGRSERTGTFIVLAGTISTFVLQKSILFDWTLNRTGLMVIDVVVLAAFMQLAFHTRRFWPLWATAFHLIAVCSHGVAFMVPNPMLQTYAFLQGFWVYPIMFSIMLGALSRQRRLKTSGRDSTL